MMPRDTWEKGTKDSLVHIRQQEEIGAMSEWVVCIMKHQTELLVQGLK